MDDLQEVMKNLAVRYRNALVDTQNELIPPWCTGFQDVFWESDAIGREFVRLWFQLNRDDAISRRRAAILLFGYNDNSARLHDQLMEEYLTQYPAPWWFRRRYMKFNFKGGGNTYFLRSEVMRLRLVILARLEKERAYARSRPRRL